MRGDRRQPLRKRSRLRARAWRLFERVMERFGYQVMLVHKRKDTPLERISGEGYELVRPVRRDGSFDYEAYRAIQTAANKRKLESVWALEENIAFLADYIERRMGKPAFGICHGTRRGKEQEWFRKYLGCEVIGTEISDTAEQFPHTIQWDFHEVKPEWIDAVDFIYSNSFDHTYDPQKCLDAWMSCVRPDGGLCLIEHSSADGTDLVNEVDPFGADISVMPYLIALWGKGRYGVREILDAPAKHKGDAYLKFLVIQRF